MNNQSVNATDSPSEPLEDSRRRQLVEVTIDSLAELGYVGTTLAQIAGRAGVSAGLVSHYFGDKDGLLDAAFRSLTRRVGDHVRARLRQISTPRARIQAVIDANLSQEEFSQRTGTAWLAFWGQVLQVPSLKRVQSVYQRRTLTNLRTSLKRLVPPDEAHSLAAMIAAMIDGVWLRAALSGWREADSETARALLTEFVDGRLNSGPARSSGSEERTGAGGARTASPAAGERFATFNPATGEVLGYVTVAGATQVNAAVRTAQRGQARWASMTGAERAKVLRRAAGILRARNQELAELETRDTGKPIQETSVVDVVSGADCLEYFAALAQSLSGEHIDLGPQAFGYTRREPLGVVAGIGAWNYPLQIACWKAAPALACGNAMIFKPAELTPLTAVKLEEILLEASGQVCSNATRVFVHASIKAEFLARLVKRVGAMQVGDPLDPATQVGALVSEQHLHKVLGYIDRGRAEGARLLVGGYRVTTGELGNGYFVAPAVFDNCRDDMGIVREEIFGPVMSVMDFEDELDVIGRANATEFGLAAGVFTNDLTRGHRVIAQLQAGTCWINHYNVTPIELPFGGVKMSGLGRENGRAAIEHYTQLKSVYVAMGDVDAPY